MVEVWRKIADLPYEVSSMGRVRREDTGYILKPNKRSGGYRTIAISVNGYQETRNVHRLVAEHFCLYPEGFDDGGPALQVNHINGVKHDNRHINLEWVTARENVLHSLSTGKNRKLSDNDVRAIRRRSENGETLKKVAQDFPHVSYGTVCDAARGRTFSWLK